MFRSPNIFCFIQLLPFLLICLGSKVAKAQNLDTLPPNKVDSNQVLVQPIPNPSQQEVDIMDLLKSIGKAKHSKPAPKYRRVQISAVPAVGYSLQTGLAGVVSGNVVIQPKDSSGNHTKPSFFTSSIAYTQYKQVILPFRASLWAGKGRYNLQLDWRFMKYPSETYGLGAFTNRDEGYSIDFSYLKLHQLVVTQLKGNLYAGLGYFFDRFWNIRELDMPPQSPSDYQQYGLFPTATASGFTAQLLFDNRKNPINPNNGWYGNVLLRPNIAALGAGSNWTSLQIDLRHYLRFPARSQNVLGFWSFNWVTLGGGNPPYLLLPSTGWDDFFNTGRGYIQGRFRGTSMVYVETEYRFKITRRGLLGGVLFANAQSFAQAPEAQFRRVSPAYGVGLRIKLNKYSGANLAIDYGIGLQGSQGISVNIGEIF